MFRILRCGPRILEPHRRHVLPEAMAHHRHAMTQLHERYARPGRPPRGPRNRHYRNAHLAFISIARHERHLSFRQANVEWNGMVEMAKAAYDEYVSVDGEEDESENDIFDLDQGQTFVDVAAAISLFGIGSAEYPLCAM